jgi:hypothetical protein
MNVLVELSFKVHRGLAVREIEQPLLIVKKFNPFKDGRLPGGGSEPLPNWAGFGRCAQFGVLIRGLGEGVFAVAYM